MLQGTEVTLTPRFSLLAAGIPLCNHNAKRQYDSQSCFKDLGLGFAFPGLQIPRIHIQRAPSSDRAPGCLPQNHRFPHGQGK